MKPATREWVGKAEADFLSAYREYRARLIEAGKPTPRTHDLPALLDAVLPVEPLWEAFRPQCDTLTSYAVVFRYPGESATRAMAKAALADCRSFRRELRRSLGLRAT